MVPHFMDRRPVWGEQDSSYLEHSFSMQKNSAFWSIMDQSQSSAAKNRTLGEDTWMLVFKDDFWRELRDKWRCTQCPKCSLTCDLG